MKTLEFLQSFGNLLLTTCFLVIGQACILAIGQRSRSNIWSTRTCTHLYATEKTRGHLHYSSTIHQQEYTKGATRADSKKVKNPIS